TAAINIQHKFREYRKNYNHIINSTSTIKFALTLKLKTRIIKHMELLNKQIKFSETADAIQKFSETELYYNSIYNPIYNSIINNPITNATTENLKQILAHGITTSNLLCNDLAMALAILIRADNQLTIEIKQNTHVCKVGGHVMCCIGKPNDPNSIIIDPWIRYLNLYPTTGYRDITVLHNAPNRIGFIGTVAQYKSFLQAHPNKYVPRNSDLTITIHPQFSENTKSISPSDIRLDSMLL
ncbi:MAG: hypothetical protein QG673_1965, partial [Pseudomonadota bacterium]|nr:hypothetical protein [Pseudomonadota bacterium]